MSKKIDKKIGLCYVGNRLICNVNYGEKPRRFEMPLTDIRSFLGTAVFVAVAFLSLFGACLLFGLKPASNPDYYGLFFWYFFTTVAMHIIRFGAGSLRKR